MQFEDASRRMRRLALVLATLVALPTLLPTSAAAGTGAARHEQRSELAGRTARSHITLLAFGSGYQQAGGSPAVRTLQRRLTRLGYAPGPVDGRFGPRTRAAGIAFQTRPPPTAARTPGRRPFRPPPPAALIPLQPPPPPDRRRHRRTPHPPPPARPAHHGQPRRRPQPPPRRATRAHPAAPAATARLPPRPRRRPL